MSRKRPPKSPLPRHYTTLDDEEFRDAASTYLREIATCIDDGSIRIQNIDIDFGSYRFSASRTPDGSNEKGITACVTYRRNKETTK